MSTAEAAADAAVTDHDPEPLPASLVHQAARLMPQKLKAFIDFVTPRMKTRLVFDA